MAERLCSLGLVAAALFMAVAMASPPAFAADHRDAPLTAQDRRQDINDIYAFQSPENRRNVVLIMTVNPAAGIESPTTFHPGGVYEFKVDVNGDAVEDLTFRITFGRPNAAGVQTLELRSVAAPKGRGKAKGNAKGRLLAKGRTGRDVDVRGGGTIHAAIFDDPFFFDSVAFNAFRAGTGPLPADSPNDFFDESNINAIVLEVPRTMLGTNNVGIWARTETRQGRQFDRVGRPAINTVLIPAGRKDAFNFTAPRNDVRKFRDDVIASLIALGNNPTRANSLAGVLLPDILTINTSSRDGFLNGRQLADDVIDAELDLLTNGAVISDGIDANDLPFSDTFPYLAPPQPVP